MRCVHILCSWYNCTHSYFFNSWPIQKVCLSIFISFSLQIEKIPIKRFYLWHFLYFQHWLYLKSNIYNDDKWKRGIKCQIIGQTNFFVLHTSKMYTTGKQLDVEEDFYTNVFLLHMNMTATHIHMYNNKGKAINATWYVK